ncbi:MAG: tetratricopeptide repeat protein [Cytophagales bacterium]|nr:tetratricopeptide repeat protein [Cytophagales bacterium]
MQKAYTILIRNLLLVFFPKGYLVLLVAAVLLALTDGHALEGSILILNVLAIHLGFKLSVFIHECGHLFFAKLAGAQPRQLHLGSGQTVYRKRIGQVTLFVHEKIHSGLAVVSFDGVRNVKLCLFFYILGGIGFNLCAAILLYLIQGKLHFNFTQHCDPLNTLALVNFFLAFVSLFPFRSEWDGSILYSDGLQMLNLPFDPAPDATERRLHRQLLDAMDSIEDQNYPEAVQLLERYLEEECADQGVYIYLSDANIKTGNIEEAEAALQHFEVYLDEKPYRRHRKDYFHTRAKLCLLHNSLIQAGRWADLALEESSSDLEVQATRAWIWIEAGMWEKGEQLLYTQTSRNFITAQAVLNASYLSKAYCCMGKVRRCEKYRLFAQQHAEVLGWEGRLLYERLWKKQKNEALPKELYQPVQNV